MSLLSTADQTKLDELTALMQAARRGAGDDVQVVELVAVTWPAPDGRIFYASTFADDLFPALRAHLDGARVEPRLNGGQFLDITRDSGISDDAVALDFWDADNAISDLFETHGEGVRVEIYFYFPQVDLLLSQWHGHLRPPEDADEERFTARAENGFMSVMLPLPRRAFYNTCQAVFGGLLATQLEIDEHDCPWNLHIRGSVGVPGSELLPPCPRNSRQACIDRLGDSLSFLAFDTIIQSYSIGSKGVIASSRDNANNLKRPLRVIAGPRTVRGLDVLEYVVENGSPSHPERGSIKLLAAVGEGWQDGLSQPKANNTPIQPQHYSTRPGAPRQPSTGFTANVNNYPQTALLNCVLQGDYRNVDPASIQLEIHTLGDKTVRVYASDDPSDFEEQNSIDRAWWLLHTLRHKRWGMGGDVRRFAIKEDFIPLSAWFAENLSFTGQDGNAFTGPRSNFIAELIDRTAQEQINDICLAGRCTLPVPFEGKDRVFPLKKLTEEELAAAPVFTDYDSGYERNIIRDPDTNKSSLTRGAISDRDLPNAIKITFDDAEHDFQEHPFVVESVEQQLRAGRAYGDTGRRNVEKPYGLVGVSRYGEAYRIGVSLRDLGPFDEGGIENNQRVKFQTFFTHAIGLYKSKVIRVLSRKLINRRTGVQKFEFFRVRYVHPLPNLLVEISAQAYPVAYYETFESPVVAVGHGGTGVVPNPGGGIGARPRDVLVGTVTHTNDRIRLPLMMSL